MQALSVYTCGSGVPELRACVSVCVYVLMRGSPRARGS